MKYGLIGEKLGHSFSKEIHGLLCDYTYELCEIAPENLDAFMTEKSFCAINVTIPYKEKVIPYLESVDDAARGIGAVNTVVNRGGKLYGYNTDFYGMKSLIEKNEIDVSGKKVLILGSGGTSKTATAVCRSLGAEKIIRVSRTATDGSVSYEEAYEKHSDAQIIINTTPVGMYPNSDGCPIDISKFESLCGVLDAVYNPLRTKLVRQAQKRGIKSAGGLYMLVAQALRACEIFTDTTLPGGTLDKVYSQILSGKENIILCGMPGAGKTTIGKLLAEKLTREFTDTDDLIRERCGCEIPEIFREHGEEYFRDVETQVIVELSKENGKVIALGGGAVLREENADALRQNGRIIFLDAELATLLETSDRPLSNTREKLEALYNTRYGIYCERCDIRVEINRDAKENTERVLSGFKNIL